ncbi:hypothetical protein BpHYR1_005894 [Brachionus plicatilis]|uniref:Uncharacterized protein n=1 Tax=Brachionus plicatilis TaxID=10195 RepID=A0A3M7QL62_BRAPC|nr:hypothetical protein BpHYR1_005894 [Brachionus plicatilis]
MRQTFVQTLSWFEVGDCEESSIDFCDWAIKVEPTSGCDCCCINEGDGDRELLAVDSEPLYVFGALFNRELSGGGFVSALVRVAEFRVAGLDTAGLCSVGFSISVSKQMKLSM